MMCAVSKRGAVADMGGSAIDIAETLAQLSALTIFELRGEWWRLHRAPPPMLLSRDLLIRGITYKFHERACGGVCGPPHDEGRDGGRHDRRRPRSWLSRPRGRRR
jgi:hypothetical protein